MHRVLRHSSVCMCACVHGCGCGLVCACVHLCMRAFLHVCMCAWMCVWIDVCMCGWGEGKCVAEWLNGWMGG